MSYKLPDAVGVEEMGRLDGLGRHKRVQQLLFQLYIMDGDVHLVWRCGFR